MQDRCVRTRFRHPDRTFVFQPDCAYPAAEQSTTGKPPVDDDVEQVNRPLNVCTPKIAPEETRRSMKLPAEVAMGEGGIEKKELDRLTAIRAWSPSPDTTAAVSCRDSSSGQALVARPSIFAQPRPSSSSVNAAATLADPRASVVGRVGPGCVRAPPQEASCSNATDAR